jgi:hypothetical protein
VANELLTETVKAPSDSLLMDTSGLFLVLSFHELDVTLYFPGIQLLIVLLSFALNNTSVLFTVFLASKVNLSLWSRPSSKSIVRPVPSADLIVPVLPSN